jgi:hypothetical protein
MAASRRNACRVHSAWFSAQQRIHLTTLLILLLGCGSLFAGDIAFDPSITEQEFHTFSALVGQATFATPVEPASARSIFGFDIGVAATAVPIDENASYWLHSVSSDISSSGYVAAPRLVVSKGLGVATVAGTYMEVPNSGARVIGGSVDVPIIRGGLVEPSLSFRASYSDLRGVDVFKLKSYGAEVFLSKGFGPVTPYIGTGLMRVKANGVIEPTTGFPGVELSDRFDKQRTTLGVKFSLLVVKFVVEATQSEERSYAAKVSFGL